MPASWAAEALKAQAVVARSYALRSRRRDRAFDLYPDVRSQVYRGVAGETAADHAAVRATRALRRAATAARSPRRSSTPPPAGAPPATRRASAAARAPYLRPGRRRLRRHLARAHVDACG